MTDPEIVPSQPERKIQDWRELALDHAINKMVFDDVRVGIGYIDHARLEVTDSEWRALIGVAYDIYNDDYDFEIKGSDPKEDKALKAEERSVSIYLEATEGWDEKEWAEATTHYNRMSQSQYPDMKQWQDDEMERFAGFFAPVDAWTELPSVEYEGFKKFLAAGMERALQRQEAKESSEPKVMSVKEFKEFLLNGYRDELQAIRDRRAEIEASSEAWHMLAVDVAASMMLASATSVKD